LFNIDSPSEANNLRNHRPFNDRQVKAQVGIEDLEFELTISIDRILEATLDSLAYNYQKIPAEEAIMEVSRVGMNKITSSTPRHRYQQNFGFE
jgi:hypothetical protein